MGACVSQLLSLKQTTISGNAQCSCWRRDKQCILFRAKIFSTNQNRASANEVGGVWRVHTNPDIFETAYFLLQESASVPSTRNHWIPTPIPYFLETADPVHVKQDKRIIRPIYSKSSTVLDFGFHEVDSGFQVLDSSICQWNLDSGFQSLVGFRNPWAVFRIPKPRIPESISKIFPDSGIRSPLYGAEIIMRFLKMCGFVWTWPN